ncbi:hypothetical protein BD414DRAFT_272306 [Trametes punicea]|nr:hypothetical protein BD414DRAFT_272306 [Trametes punicea]
MFDTACYRANLGKLGCISTGVYTASAGPVHFGENWQRKLTAAQCCPGIAESERSEMFRANMWRARSRLRYGAVGSGAERCNSHWYPHSTRRQGGGICTSRTARFPAIWGRRRSVHILTDWLGLLKNAGTMAPFESAPPILAGGWLYTVLSMRTSDTLPKLAPRRRTMRDLLYRPDDDRLDAPCIHVSRG